MEAGAQGTDLVVRHFGDLLVKCLDLKIGCHSFVPRVVELPMAFLRALGGSCARGRNTGTLCTRPRRSVPAHSYHDLLQNA
jgi:hypothetical protein